MLQKTKNQFIQGLKDGVPILLGYLTVSFTFGLTVTKGGMPGWLAVLLSMTNLTSAGQFAGANLILSGANMVEIAFTVFIINIRYSLMSLSLSQQLEPNIGVGKRLLLSFGITDEIFAVASMKRTSLGFPYLIGLIIGPFIGWSFGTYLGSVTNGLLPVQLQMAFGIALYAMFIALVVPPSRKSKPILVTSICSVAISCCFQWIPFLRSLFTDGWIIIIAAIAAAALGAVFFPITEERHSKEGDIL